MNSTPSSEPLAQTPLHAWHSAHGGRMVDFAGWSMPVQYSSIVDEHTATRTQAGLFDISHMGRLRFDGTGARDFLEHLLTRRVHDMRPGQIRYSLLTNDSGAVLDDVLLYALNDAAGGEYWLLVVNASNREKVVHWLQPRLAVVQNVTMTDVTRQWAMIAVQGPRAIQLLQPLVDAPLASMKYYTGVECRIAGHGGIVSRTGYTGEDGCELILGNNAVTGVWQQLIDGGAKACGLGARDTLRLEAGMPLYGHELSEEISLWYCGLGFAINLKDRSFPGCDALEMTRMCEGVTQRVGIVLESKRVPREHYPVVNAAGQKIGETTSGTFSPTLNQPIAMAFVSAEHAAPGTSVAIDIRGKHEPGRVVELPFYRRAK